METELNFAAIKLCWSALLFMYIHCLSRKKSHSLFALITERICCGIVSTTLCNVTTYISTHSCIHFGRDFELMTGESNHSFSLFQHIPTSLNGVKSDSVVANSCEKITPHGP